ncbi:DinB family protein [Fictibacillus nanhaiensis]|uniref:DinB family protein n=1 Tax=Fictibacillus nanhaiensis TaxID=742169 RepID=UPI001C95C9F3|nr:DinB family protein [Fictibacillus nanhaiensis]MBY6036676.1 DinB family protein [Fictibacillus nanhaiensis]
MSEIFFYQFNKVRNWSIGIAENLTEEMANRQPDGFNNTMKWHLGHMVTEAEYFLFELSKQPVQLPNRYNQLFAPGTRPSEWKGEAPRLSELILTLKSQLERVKEISPELLNQPLEKPIHEFNSVLDAAAFSVLHESLHIGQIESMKRMLVVSAK